MRAAMIGLMLVCLCWQLRFAAAQTPGAFAASGSDAAAANAAASPSIDRPIPTRQTTFTLPFVIDQSTSPDNQPVEVQLLVSADRGANWYLYTRQRPSEGQFSFRASRDGEYWFATRTIDAQNRALPDGPPRADLRVLIDTTAPKLDMNAEVGAAGEIKTVWQAADENLAADSLKIEFQTSPDQPWRPLAIDRSRDGAMGTTLSGMMNWWPETTSKVIDLRAEVRDAAGNSSVVNRRVFPPRVAARQPPQPQQPTTTPPANAPIDPFVYRRPPTEPAPNANAWPPDRADNTLRGGAGNEQVPYYLRPGVVSGDRVTPTYPDTASTVSTQPTTVTPVQPTQPTAPTDNRLGNANTYRPVSTPVQPPVDDRVIFDEQSGGPRAIDGNGLPSGERPRMTNVRRFNLEYDIDSVGPSGVARVEMWGTRDGGRTWTSWGTDPDRQSPFSVEVDEEGVYGFRIVIESGSGLAGRPPRPGDLADIWVGIDTTRPIARLTSAIYGTGPQAGHLDIRWDADDLKMASRPITLLFSGTPDGPWSTIAAGLPNDGQYFWRVDPRTPQQIYLRLEVRDEAGNVGVHQLADPIGVEGLAPRGHIRGLSPAEDTSRGAFRMPWNR
jgi:hypothetical protein